MKSAFQLALCALLAGGCAASGRPSPERFPIGLYNVGDPELLTVLKENGFDSFYAFGPDKASLEGLAREARRLGMRMLVSPRPYQNQPSREVRRWPIEAWYLEDEPEVNHVSAVRLQERSRKTAAWDPRRLQTFVIGSADVAKTYGHIADILMLDWYPVPHLDLDSVADQIDLARVSIPEEKPLWMVIQAFDWREHPQRDPNKPRIGRFPTSQEIRFMSYLAIVHGAKGLFYFRLQKTDGETLLDYPEQWQALTGVTREIKTLQPILERGRPVQIPFQPDPDGLEAKAWRYRGRDFLVILNRKEKVMQRVPDVLLDGTWRPLFEKRRDPKDLLTPKNGAYYLRPHEVMVFESRGRKGSYPRGWGLTSR